MQMLLLIGAGSFAGGAIRYLLMTGIQSRLLTTFPFGTLAVNTLGGLAIGIIIALSERTGMPESWRLFLATGLCGGFTTFSAFSHESMAMIRDGHAGQAFLYMGTSVFLAVLATFIGYALPKAF